MLWCIVGRRLQLPCRCAAWLAERLAGSQSQRGEAVPLQFSVSERGGSKERGKEAAEGRPADPSAPVLQKENKKYERTEMISWLFCRFWTSALSRNFWFVCVD